METTGGIRRRPTDEVAELPGDLDAMPADPTAETVEAEEIGTTSCVAAIEASEDVGGTVSTDVEDTRTDTTGSAESDPECDAPAGSGKRAKGRSTVRLTVDTEWLKAAWRAHSLGRVAVLAVCVYTLAVGSAYFFVMQPLSNRLHQARDQKSALHDYMVIEQAGAAISAFKNGLMTGDQRLTVMSEVNLMAEQSGVKIAGDPELLLKRAVSGRIVEYPVRLRVRGSYHEMGEFLSLLEGSPRFVLVEEVEMRSDAASRSSESEATVLLTLAAWEG